jgi:uncharacterized protein
MRLSREKVNQLAQLLAEELASRDEVDFIEDRNTIRLEIIHIINDELKKEEGIDQAARKKIESQKRNVPEGSVEWDILYRKYYSEAVKSL